MSIQTDSYRWEIEDRTALGLGYSAKLYRAGEPRAIAAREGFSTREGAVEWATKYQGGRYSLIDYVLIGMAVTAGVSAFVSLVRLFRGEATVRHGYLAKSTRAILPPGARPWLNISNVHRPLRMPG